MGKAAVEAVRRGFVFGKQEIVLVFVVVLHLIASYFIFSINTANTALLAVLQLAVVLAENYVTVAVYCGVKGLITEGRFTLAGIFLKAGHFFGRVLLYKVLAGLAVLAMLVFAFGIIDVLKSAAIVKTAFVAAATVVWLAFPAYFLALTFLTPLVIVFEGVFLTDALKKSVIFARNELPGILVLLLFLLPAWAFAFFLLKVYNEKALFLQTGIFFFSAMLEVATIKVFMLFYKRKG